jgi:hypothetical protein
MTEESKPAEPDRDADSRLKSPHGIPRLKFPLEPSGESPRIESRESIFVRTKIDFQNPSKVSRTERMSSVRRIYWKNIQ